MGKTKKSASKAKSASKEAKSTSDKENKEAVKQPSVAKIDSGIKLLIQTGAKLEDDLMKHPLLWESDDFEDHVDKWAEPQPAGTT